MRPAFLWKSGLADTSQSGAIQDRGDEALAGIGKRQAARLADRFHVVMPDQRGYNLSDKPREVSAYRVPVLVEDVAALVESYGRGKAHAIVGHDWGAAVAWGVGMLRPEITERLVIENVPHPAVMREFLRNDPAQRRRSWRRGRTCRHC